MLIDQVSNILISLQFIGSGLAQTNWARTGVDMQADAPSNTVRRGRKVRIVCLQGGDNVDIV